MRNVNTMVHLIIIIFLFLLIILAITLGTIAILSRCYFFNEVAPKMMNLSNIDYIRYQHNIPQITIIDKADDINEFVSVLEPLIYKKDSFDTTLMIARFTIYFKSGEKIDIIFRGNHISIDGKKYMTNSNVTDKLYSIVDKVDNNN